MPRPRRASGPTTLSSGTVLQFLRSIWRLEHALERASKRMEDSMGISGPQRFALRMIATHPGLSSSELADALHLHRSTITGITRRLVSRRLITRTANTADGRVVHLHLTDAGRAITRPAAAGTIERAVTRALTRTSATQRASAEALLDTLTNELTTL